MLSITPLMTSAGMWDELVSDDELGRLTAPAGAWAELLQRCVDQEPDYRFADEPGLPWADMERATRNLDEVFRLQPLNESNAAPYESVPDDDEIDAATLRRASRDPRVAYAMSSRFINRVIDWLNRLLVDDLAGVIDWAAPPPAVFNALPSSPLTEEIGLWIWDRYTKTELSEWSTSSLLREWKGNEDDALDHRVWSERDCPTELVAELALSRLTAKVGPERPSPRLKAEVSRRPPAGISMTADRTKLRRSFKVWQSSTRLMAMP